MNDELSKMIRNIESIHAYAWKHDNEQPRGTERCDGSDPDVKGYAVFAQGTPDAGGLFEVYDLACLEGATALNRSICEEIAAHFCELTNDNAELVIDLT